MPEFVGNIRDRRVDCFLHENRKFGAKISAAVHFFASVREAAWEKELVMFTRLLCLFVMGFVVLPVFSRVDAAGGDLEKFDGKVFAVNEKSVTVGTDEDQHAFMITKDTKITLDGEPVRWADLKFGFSATVFAMRHGDNAWAAHEIAAYANE